VEPFGGRREAAESHSEDFDFLETCTKLWIIPDNYVKQDVSGEIYVSGLHGQSKLQEVFFFCVVFQ
jgi:hypothetical protein